MKMFRIQNFWVPYCHYSTPCDRAAHHQYMSGLRWWILNCFMPQFRRFATLAIILYKNIHCYMDTIGRELRVNKVFAAWFTPLGYGTWIFETMPWRINTYNKQNLWILRERLKWRAWAPFSAQADQPAERAINKFIYILYEFMCCRRHSQRFELQSHCCVCDSANFHRCYSSKLDAGDA